MNNKEAYIQIKDVSMWYAHKGQGAKKEGKWIKAVDGITLNIEKGEILGVIGESGCGKSTLGKILVRLENPTAGDVAIEGISTKELISKDSHAFRRMAQIIFQNPFDSFTPRDTIGKILQRPLKNHKIGNTKQERADICEKALESAGLKPGKDIMSRYPHELSGGQLQRISIIRAMLLNPKFIVADEPVSMLDVSVRADIINMLLDLSKNNDSAIVFISHDIALTRYISSKIAVMYLGRIVEYGKTDEIIANPLHPYTKALISNCASIDINEVMEVIDIDGEPPTPLDPGPGCYFYPRCSEACDQCKNEYPNAIDYKDGHMVSCHKVKTV